MMMNGERERERKNLLHCKKDKVTLNSKHALEKTFKIIMSDLLHHHASVGRFSPFMKNL